MSINVGSVLTWSSAAGQLLGSVTNIRLELNAAETLVPWVTVKRWDTESLITICGTDSNLKMLAAKVIKMETK